MCFLPNCRYNEAGVALLRPLAPGEPTWPELLEAAQKQKEAEASAQAALAAATQVSCCVTLCRHDCGGLPDCSH